VSQDRPVLVVGATGFIGGALVSALRRKGDRVRAVARRGAASGRLAALGAEPVEADLLDPQSLRRAAAGTQLIYHAGGLNTMCPKEPGRLFEVNVQGTLNLVEAAAAAGVARVVYTSSAATLGERRGTVATVDCDHRGFYLSTYERSKHLAERAALERARALGVELVCVNPSSVQGPGRTGGTARWLIRYANGRLRWMVDTRVSLVAVDDCVTAHLQAARLGVAGRRYLVNGATLGIQELIELVGELTGQRQAVRIVPAWAARMGGTLVGASFELAGRRPPVCQEMVRTLLHGHAYDGSRAAQELEFSYTPINEFLAATMAWYWEQGLVRRPPQSSA
jgi:dihydroflavonol-4-reductase